jgi:ATP-dependent DNA ligase
VDEKPRPREKLFAAICEAGLEGVIAKRIDAHYAEQRV